MWVKCPKCGDDMCWDLDDYHPGTPNLFKDEEISVSETWKCAACGHEFVVRSFYVRTDCVYMSD